MVESILLRSKRSSVPIQDAKRWYAQHQHLTRSLTEGQITSFSLTPDWDYPQIVLFKDSVELLMVPVKENLDSIFHNANYQLVFSKDSLNNIQTRLLVLSATDEYYEIHKNNFSTSDFTGFSMSIDEEGIIRYPLLINQGHMYNIGLDSLYNSINNRVRGGSPQGCWDGSISLFGSIYGWIQWVIYFTKLHGGGTGNDGDNFPGNWGWGFWGWPPCGNNPGGSGGGNGNSGWNTNPNGPGIGFGFNFLNNYFSDAVFESSQYRNQVKKCKGNFIYSNDVNTPVLFAIDKSTFGFDYRLFLGAYDYYLDQLSQGNTNFQLKDAFTIVQTPPSTYKFFPNPINLAQWKPKLDPIYQKIKKDYDDHNSCTGPLNDGPEGNSSCNCFEYMVEDVKEDLINSLYQLTNDEKNFFNSNADLQPDLFYFLANNNDPIVIGTLLYKLFRSVLDSEEAKYFYDYYMIGVGGEVHLSTSAFMTVLDDIANYSNTLNIKPNIVDGNPVNQKDIQLKKGAKYYYVLHNFAYYEHPNGLPYGLFDTYDFDSKNGSNIFYTIMGKNPSRGIYGEWITRAQNVVDILVTSPFSLYHPKPFNIKYP